MRAADPGERRGAGDLPRAAAPKVGGAGPARGLGLRHRTGPARNPVREPDTDPAPPLRRPAPARARNPEKKAIQATVSERVPSGSDAILVDRVYVDAAHDRWLMFNL